MPTNANINAVQITGKPTLIHDATMSRDVKLRTDNSPAQLSIRATHSPKLTLGVHRLLRTLTHSPCSLPKASQVSDSRAQGET